jgi:hypothetical protein
MTCVPHFVVHLASGAVPDDRETPEGKKEIFLSRSIAYYYWLTQLKARTHANVATVALANKQARTAWALLIQGTFYETRPMT